MFVQHRCTDFVHGEGRKIPGDGVVTGWGTVNGRTVVRVLQGFHRVRRLAVGTHAAKITKIQDMALKMRAPIIGCSMPAGRAFRRVWPRSAAMARCSAAM